MRRLAVIVAALALLLAGCSTVKGMLDTQRALERDGFVDADVGFDSTNGVDTVTVRYAGDLVEDGRQMRAAEIVWDTLPLRFDWVQVGTRAPISHDALAGRFGPRPSSHDERTIGDDLSRTGKQVLLGVAVAGVVVLGIIVLVIVLVVRASRRRRQQQPWPAYGAGAPPPGWGQPPGWGPQPPPPGWGQQPPPPGWGQPPPPP